MDEFNPINEMIKAIGPPTAKSLKRLHAMESDCQNRKDPNSFYLTLTLGDPVRIDWTHNVDRLLGIANLTHPQYFSLIHPDWLPLHLGFAESAYLVAAKIIRNQPGKQPVYTTNVPLRHQNGTYQWYNQVSFPVAFDEKGLMVSHLNQYHRLCDFDKLVPIRPRLTIDNVWQRECDADFARRGNSALAASLNAMLTPANYRILEAYRVLATLEDGQWLPPLKKEVRESLDLTATAINKANVRIIQSVKGRFPDSVTHDVARFSCFLNELCGAPAPAS